MVSLLLLFLFQLALGLKRLWLLPIFPVGFSARLKTQTEYIAPKKKYSAEIPRGLVCAFIDNLDTFMMYRYVVSVGGGILYGAATASGAGSKSPVGVFALAGMLSCVNCYQESN